MHDDGIIEAAKLKLNEIIKQEEEENMLKMKKEQEKNFDENGDLNQEEPVRTDSVPGNPKPDDIKINRQDTIVKPEKK